MTKQPAQLSFSKAEKEITARLQHDLTLARSGEDAKKFFIRAAQHLLTEASAGEIAADYHDITLTPNAAPAFAFSPALRDNPAFSRLWHGSDLPAIVGRMADRAAHIHTHLEKHLEKAEAKIYHLDR